MKAVIADTVTYSLSVQQLLLPEELLHSDINHLLIAGVDVKTATDMIVWIWRLPL